MGTRMGSMFGNGAKHTRQKLKFPAVPRGKEMYRTHSHQISFAWPAYDIMEFSCIFPLIQDISPRMSTGHTMYTGITVHIRLTCILPKTGNIM